MRLTITCKCGYIKTIETDIKKLFADIEKEEFPKCGKKLNLASRNKTAQ